MWREKGVRYNCSRIDRNLVNESLSKFGFPMISRRNVIRGIGGTAVATLTVPGGVLSPGEADAASPAPVNDEPEQLLYELARLEARYYTEEGVAMMLACENLAGSPATGFEPGELNRRFTDDFVRHADALAGLRSDLAEQDVAAIVELIAYRDLASTASVDE